MKNKKIDSLEEKLSQLNSQNKELKNIEEKFEEYTSKLKLDKNIQCILLRGQGKSRVEPGILF